MAVFDHDIRQVLDASGGGTQIEPEVVAVQVLDGGWHHVAQRAENVGCHRALCRKVPALQQVIAVHDPCPELAQRPDVLAGPAFGARPVVVAGEPDRERARRIDFGGDVQLRHHRLPPQNPVQIFIDPRGAQITVGDWRERCAASRRQEKATAKWEQSIWSQHVAPAWQTTRLESILRPDVNAWVSTMEKAGVGAHTIIGGINVLSGLFELAVDARLIRMNAARGVRRPRLPDHIDRTLTPGEQRVLLASLDEKFGDRVDGHLFVEVLIECGLRWEEAAALDRSHVNMRRKLVHVNNVMERDGTVREYPKSKAGARLVPVGDDLWPRLRDLAMTRKADGLLFLSPKGEPLNYHNWKKRVWDVALHEVERGKRGKIMSRTPIMAEPLPTPHDCRHTFGTRLAEQGVPQHEIGALLGHSPGSLRRPATSTPEKSVLIGLGRRFGTLVTHT